MLCLAWEKRKIKPHTKIFYTRRVWEMWVGTIETSTQVSYGCATVLGAQLSAIRHSSPAERMPLLWWGE